LSGFWVLPIEIGLLRAEKMEVVLLGMLIPFPHTACKVGDPVVRGFSLTIDIAGWSPDVPVSLGIVF
jgi:hypothetical protein